MSHFVALSFARKPANLHDVKAVMKDSDSEIFECEIAETVELPTGEYDAFTRLMYKNWDWLDGKGGYKNCVRQVIAVTAPGRETLYVDPSGSAYGRYVGIKRMEEPPAVKYPHVHVQLTGKDGNAFMVMGLCQRAAQKAGLSKAEIDEFFKEAQAGDYDHLLATCMQWFDVD